MNGLHKFGEAAFGITQKLLKINHQTWSENM